MIDTNVKVDPAPDPAAALLVKDLHDRYASYHDHKESMAYAGITLFGAAAVAALLADDWPPTRWGDSRNLLGAVALAALWFGVLLYLRFQLRRRRWAALRVAGCHRILLRWLASPPRKDELVPTVRSPMSIPVWRKLVDWFFPLTGTVPVLEPDEPPLYPQALVKAWEERECQPTGALEHERLIIVAGWLLFAATLVFTLCGRAA